MKFSEYFQVSFEDVWTYSGDRISWQSNLTLHSRYFWYHVWVVGLSPPLPKKIVILGGYSPLLRCLCTSFAKLHNPHPAYGFTQNYFCLCYLIIHLDVLFPLHFVTSKCCTAVTSIPWPAYRPIYQFHCVTHQESQTHFGNHTLS